MTASPDTTHALEGHKLRHAARAGVVLAFVTALFALAAGIALAVGVINHVEHRAVMELLVIKLGLTLVFVLTLYIAWRRHCAYQLWRKTGAPVS